MVGGRKEKYAGFVEELKEREKQWNDLRRYTRDNKHLEEF